MGRKQAHVYFSGRVQGVFFRASTEDIALSMGLSGWVRNMPDGRVEALFVGEEEVVKGCISRLENGPRGAHVEDVQVEWAEAGQDNHGFTVRYG